MENHYIKEFVILAQLHNFQEAAEALFISQSSLSKHIKTLEKELGVSLFDRTTRKVSLSSYGQLFLPYAQQITELQDKCSNAINAAKKNSHRTLTLGSIPSMPQYGISDLIVHFKKQYPEDNVSIMQDVSSKLEAALLDGSCEIAFIREVQDPGQKLVQIPFYIDMLTAVLPVNHKLANEGSLSFAQLENENFLLLPKNSRPYKVCQTACAQYGFEPKVAFTTHNIENIIDLVSKGMGITLLMKQLASYSAAKNPAVRIIDILPQIESHITLCYKKKSLLSPITKKFLHGLSRLQK
jgi:Transcriptional regulator